MYLVSATTKATSWCWKRTLSVASTACTSALSVGIQASFRPAKVCPVITAAPPGNASAALVSMADAGVRVRAAQDGGEQHAGHGHVVDVIALPTKESRILDAGHPAEPDRVPGRATGGAWVAAGRRGRHAGTSWLGSATTVLSPLAGSAAVRPVEG